MALTITENRHGITGDLRYKELTAGFDTTYAAGGEPLTPATLGFDTIYIMRAEVPAGYQVSYDYTNRTLRAYRIGIASSAIVADGNNSLVRSAASEIEVAGTGTAFQAALVEVTTGADMSTDLAAVRLIVFGR